MPFKFAAAILLSFASLPALAAECEVDVAATDKMTFDTDAIEISKSCETFTVNLQHIGSMGISSMGHNWVLTKESDVSGITTAGIAAGLDNDYLPTEDDRIIAHTDLIGGGESSSTTFDVADLEEGKDYTFFCSFPGHSTAMRGSVTLVE
ncbi:azurin [Halomonas llamarensis]|uniref:Azurin n=1 Tax=Halomonas llamarensis TaxID=2945104 RepID=A0ABT0SLQ7_9GAMM|nr:azurin [Halomonas llamarensis]MCL7928735.1 azurin [Halomonas llamarensis]